MKSYLFLSVMLSAGLLGSCRDAEETSLFTSREVAYSMTSASDYDIRGVATFREKTNGDLQLTVQLENTAPGGQHPGHMHYGTVDVPGSEMALMLTPVDGATGSSVTTFNRLANGASFGFDDLMGFDGSLKVHLDGGPNKDVVLAGANIGQNVAALVSNIAVCATPTE